MVVRGHQEKYELYLNDNIYCLQTSFQRKNAQVHWPGQRNVISRA